MPCIDHYPSDSESRLANEAHALRAALRALGVNPTSILNAADAEKRLNETQKNIIHVTNLNAKLTARNNILARLLCAAGRARKNKTDIPPDVLEWWEEHCKADEARGEPW